MLSRFRKATTSSARVGIVLADRSFALALVSRDASAKPSIAHCAVHEAGPGLGQALKTTLEKLGATRATACAVVDWDDYQVVQVEAPDVLPSEMRAAIRWRLRDIINFNVDEAAVDVFEIPEPVRHTAAKMLFAVAARDSAIQRLANTLKPVAKGFQAVDIPELCLRNLSAVLPQDSKGVAMLALHRRFAQLVITRQGVLYVTRRIDTARGFNPHDRDRDAEDIDAGALALELQRSLDYYESHYDQAPIGDLVIAPADDRARRLATELKSETSLRIAVLDVRDLFNVPHSGDIATDWPSLMALGAALRTDSDGT